MFERPAAGVAVLTAPSVDALLDDVLASAPDAWSAAVLDDLDLAGLTLGQREKYLKAWDRQAGWVMARRAEAVALLADAPDDPPPTVVVGDTGPERVAFVTGMTVNAAHYEVETARALRAYLVGLRAHLGAGLISWRMVTEFVRETRMLDIDAQVAVESRLLDKPVPFVVDQRGWRRRLRRARQAEDADSDARRRRAVVERAVMMHPLPDGMAVVEATLSADRAVTVMAALTAAADAIGADDARTMDQRRADVFADTFAALLADPGSPRRHGRRIRVQVTGGIRTLLGLAHDPGELAGYGPISAEHLRELAADGQWHRFLTAEDTGALIAVGAASYRPNAALRELLLGRHPDCSFPGCAVPAERCDIDHSLPFDDGGATDERNCGPPCRRHHRCKTHASWQLTRHDDGAATWTSPGGFIRVVEPHRLAGDDDDAQAAPAA